MKGLGDLLKKAYAKKDAEAGASYETKSNTLRVLNERPQHIYAGTADPRKVAKSRARNKQARQSRRINRARGK
jgi:hypothetical protein